MGPLNSLLSSTSSLLLGQIKLNSPRIEKQSLTTKSLPSSNDSIDDSVEQIVYNKVEIIEGLSKELKKDTQMDQSFHKKENDNSLHHLVSTTVDQSTHDSNCHISSYSSFNPQNQNDIQKKFDSLSISTNSDIDLEEKSLEELWDYIREQTDPKQHHYLYLSNESIHGRYWDIRCPASTAVAVNFKGCYPFYLHANKVGKNLSDRTYIAAQAPVKESLPIFWKAVFDYSHTIIDLREPSKLEVYYPQDLEHSVQYGDMKIHLLSKEELNINCHVFSYKIENTADSSQKAKIVKRVNYFGWNDHGIIDKEELGYLVDLLTQASKQELNQPIVHCRAGVGRTGTLIAATILKEWIAEKKIVTPSNLKTHVTQLVIAIRKQRGDQCVTEDKQFYLLFNYGKALLENLKFATEVV